MNLTVTEVEKFGKSNFGTGWRRPLAHAIGVSPSAMWMVTTGRQDMSERFARAFRAYVSQKEAERATRRLSTRTDLIHLASSPVTPYAFVGTDYHGLTQHVLPANPTVEPLRDEEAAIAAAIDKKFVVMDRMVAAALDQTLPAVIISGPPGLGKSYGVTKQLKERDKRSYDMIGGNCTGIGLYESLYRMRNGGTVIIDDCDSVFNDESPLNLLKKALDTLDERVISWRVASSRIVSADDFDPKVHKGKMPNSFVFNGSVIFITNLDFQEKIAADTKLTEHFKALMDRSLYISLGINTAREKVIRLRQIVERVPFFAKHKIDARGQAEIMAFVVENADRFLDVSFRLLIQMATMYRMGKDWSLVAEMTKFKPA